MMIKVEDYIEKSLSKNLSVQNTVYKSANDIVQQKVMNVVQDFAENMCDKESKKVLAVATAKLNEKMEEML